MENKNNASAVSAFEAMDKAADNFFGAINDMLAAADRIEKEKMVFVDTRTKHYKGNAFQGVGILEVNSLEEITERVGYDIDKDFQRAKFSGDYGRDYKTIRNMSVGTILKLEPGHYFQRIK